MDSIKQLYMTIHSIAYSSDGNFLAAGNSYGGIAVFNLRTILDISNDEICLDQSLKFPIFQFEAHNLAVYSLISSKKLILSGSVNEICAWSWSDVKRREKERLWRLNIAENDYMLQNEVNSLAMRSAEDGTLYAGCSDNKVYCIDIKTGTIMFSLSGHTGYVHCVAAMRSQECISASEDGTVRIWDARKDGNEVHMVEPYKYKELHQPQFGKWIGCVAVNESSEWMVCGGGPMLCTWHIGSMLPASRLGKTNEAVTSHAVRFFENEIISGGEKTGLNLWTIDGKLTAEIPTSAPCVLGLNINVNNTTNEKVLSACGSSYKIDISRNFKYREFSLFYTL